MLTIFVISDATGETAERMVRSALVQFKDAPVTIVRRGQIRTAESVRDVVLEAAGHQALILHTLVSNDLRHLVLEEARLRGVDSMDLMGPVLDRLATRLSLTPLEEPGLFRQLVDARSREIEAVEFAFRHDDGQHLDELSRAEIVLVGVSRTMKTPTTLYLAYRGWYVANVPLIREIPVPPELMHLPSKKVFGLDIQAERLLEWRRVRAETFNIPLEPYASMSYIRQELIYARELYREHRWSVVDVTGKSVEEVSREILLLRSATDLNRGPAW